MKTVVIWPEMGLYFFYIASCCSHVILRKKSNRVMVTLQPHAIRHRAFALCRVSQCQVPLDFQVSGNHSCHVITKGISCGLQTTT